MTGKIAVEIRRLVKPEKKTLRLAPRTSFPAKPRCAKVGD
jgi:hypothetical protein